MHKRRKAQQKEYILLTETEGLARRTSYWELDQPENCMKG